MLYPSPNQNTNPPTTTPTNPTSPPTTSPPAAAPVYGAGAEALAIASLVAEGGADGNIHEPELAGGGL